MHPWMAVWLWSMTMSRVCANPFVEMELKPANDPAGPSKHFSAIAIPASNYLKSGITEELLPEEILDRLADLHWMELEPAMAV